MGKIFFVNLIILSTLFVGCKSADKLNEELLITVIPPSNFNSKDTIHIYGNFNDWSIEGDSAYRLNYQDGKFKVKVPVNKDNLFFSFVKNKNYAYSPASEKGKRLPQYIYQGDSKVNQIEVTIPLWTGDAPLKDVTHTLSGDVEFVREFTMPQLDRKTDISIYLPPSYTKSESKSYPVLYMLDGQNVFDEFTSFSGEWKVDEIMEQLIAQNKINELIVVAVNNGERRWNEYSPWDCINPYRGDGKILTKGEGEQTMQFIIKTLKPMIDENYRTKTDVKHTGFVGSSLGGLMALYAGVEHGDVFGFVGAFSPGLAIVNDKKEDVLLKAIKARDTIGNVRFYFDMGKVEYDGYTEIQTLEKVLLEKGVKESHLKLVKDDLGRHCEEDWSKRFPEAIQWLLQGID